MKFIFPQNYNFKNKFLGIIDYSTLIINIIFYFFIFSICNLFFKNINIKIFIFISTCFPLFILSITGLNNENIFLVLTYIIKFIKNRKIYLYNKSR